MNTHKINVLVVDCSSITRISLVQLLESDAQIRVVGVVGAVCDGRETLDVVTKLKPDLVVMDIQMPHMDGFETIRRIMEAAPVPIVVCAANSSVNDVAFAFRALEVGAIACIEKPDVVWSEEGALRSVRLLETVKLMSEVKVVRRRSRSCGTTPLAHQPVPAFPVPVRVIGIGASTGGPPVLQTILSGLFMKLTVPCLVVQHIAPGFIAGMVQWLRDTTGLDVEIATSGVIPLAGHVYMAPDNFHMGIGSDGRILLSRADTENYVKPAVSFLFRSLSEVYGAGAIGVLLTGMGHDGAQELKTMKDRGAVTIAQDTDSAVVDGMPGTAIRLGGVTHVMRPDQIAKALVALTPQVE